MSQSVRYVVYQNITYCIIAVSFSQNLNDYTFHLIEADMVQFFKETVNPNYELAIKAPIEDCVELEGKQLELARVLYERSEI